MLYESVSKDNIYSLNPILFIYENYYNYFQKVHLLRVSCSKFDVIPPQKMSTYNNIITNISRL